MCAGTAITRTRLTGVLIEANHHRIHTRGPDSEPEVRFLFRDPIAQLPVILNGKIQVIEWGNRNDKTSRLPQTGWCRRESLEAGKWTWLKPVSVVIPANYGLEKGVWFPIREGMEGVVVLDADGQPHVYMLTQAASTGYEELTKHNRMPCLIGQTI